MKRILFVIVVAVMSVTGVGTAHAAISFITNRADLAGNDYVDWSSAGSDFTNPLNPFNVTSNGGITLNVSDPSSTATFSRLDQGNGWGGNFASGDRLLFTNFYQTGPILLDFPTLIRGGGAQIQRNFFGSFTGQIEALDAGGGILAAYTLTGNSNSNGDNSAIFIGVLSDNFDIDKISFNVLPSGDNLSTEFAINQVDLVTNGPTSPVPEPATMSLLGLGVLGILGFKKRKA